MLKASSIDVAAHGLDIEQLIQGTSDYSYANLAEVLSRISKTQHFAEKLEENLTSGMYIYH